MPPPIVRSYTSVADQIENALSQSARLDIWRQEYVETYGVYCLRCTQPNQEARSLYLSAGTHGDEPAGVECALRVIERLVNDDLPFALFEWFISPCDNPFGYERNLRETQAGIDLNQTFDRPDEFPQTSFIANSLKGVNVDLAIDLHEDCDSDGFYLWERRLSSQPPIGHRIVERIKQMCPINREPVIEKHRNDNGVITLVDTVLSKGWTRGRYLTEGISPCCLILETPTHLDLETRVQIHLEAIRTALKYGM